MPNFRKLFPSKYLKAAALDGEELELVIDRLELEWVGQGADSEEKPVLYFRGRDQGLVLNVTNANTIADDDYDNWPGVTIVLYPTRVQFGTKMVDCIRVQPQPRPKRETATAAVGNGDGSSDVPF